MKEEKKKEKMKEKKEKKKAKAYTQDSWGHVNDGLHTLSPVNSTEDRGPHIESSSTGSSAKEHLCQRTQYRSVLFKATKNMNWRLPKSCLLPLQVRQGCIPWILLERQEPCSCPLPQSPGPSPCPTNPATRTAGITAVPAFAWIQSLCPRDNTAVKLQP